MTTFFQFVVVGISTGSAFAIVGMSLVLVYRATGIVNFAQGSMLVVAGYIAFAVARAGVPIWGAFLIAVIASLADRADDLPDGLDRCVTICPRPCQARGEIAALKILRYAGEPAVSIDGVDIRPARAIFGDAVSVSFNVTNTKGSKQRLLVDLCVHYVKANGKTSPKVFKLKELDLAPVRSASRPSRSRAWC